MKLFIQVAFDLNDCRKPEYEAVSGWLAQIGLGRVVPGKDGKPVRLPANTFAGIRDVYDSPSEAIAHVKEQFGLAAFWNFCEGQVHITVSPADETDHDSHNF